MIGMNRNPALDTEMLGLVPMFSVAVLAFKVIEAPPGSGQSAAERAASGKRSIKDLLQDKELRKVYMVCVIASSTWSIVSLLIPLYGSEIGLSASTIGLILGAYSFASIVIRVFMSPLARRFTGWQQMLLSLGLAGVSFIFLPLVTHVAGLMMVAFLIGLGMGLAGPLSQNLLYDVSPPDRVGEVMGLRVTVMNATSTAIPLVSGSLSAAVGVSPMFWIIALVLLGGVWSRRAQWKLARPIHPAITKASGKDRER